MDSVQELLTKLQGEVRRYEESAFDDIERLDRECTQRKNDRWRRMQEETRDMRRDIAVLIDELANAKAYERIAPQALKQMVERNKEDAMALSQKGETNEQ